MQEIKPILLIRMNDGQPPKHEQDRIEHHMKDKFSIDYNVIIAWGERHNLPTVEMEVLNAKELTEDKLIELQTIFDYARD